MRLLLLVLLLVNVAYLGWQLHRLEPQRPAAPVRVAEPSHVNRLLLLSEIDTAELRERTLQPPAPVPDPTAAPEEVAVAAVAEAPEPGVDPSRLCYSAGPLVGDDEVDAMRTWPRSARRRRAATGGRAPRDRAVLGLLPAAPGARGGRAAGEPDAPRGDRAYLHHSSRRYDQCDLAWRLQPAHLARAPPPGAQGLRLRALDRAALP